MVVCMITTASYGQFIIKEDSSSGALVQMANRADKYKMNWIFSSQDSALKWQKPFQNWGLGSYSITSSEEAVQRWTTPISVSKVDGKATYTYQTKYLIVKVIRQTIGEDLVETYQFVNKLRHKINISDLMVYTPFNDGYPNAATCATNRCNAHIWPGMNASYVNAIRMGGEGPHLGLVLTRGALSSYSIQNRGRFKEMDRRYTGSNARGTISLNVAPFELGPAGTYTLQWKLFWHKGWEDFYQKALARGFVKLDAPKYVVNKGESLKINIEANNQAGIKNKTVYAPTATIGEHSFQIQYAGGKKTTMLNYLVISSDQNRMAKRVHFIVDHQQMNDKSDPRYGAYMVYDNELKRIFDKPVNTVSNSDRDEGRERLGMGVFIAEWLQKNTDEKVRASFMRYVKFVREKLQSSDYKLYSNVSHTSRPRGYNYPWVAHLYLETFKLTGEKKYLTDFYQTMRKYFQENGYRHYSIDFRVTDAIAALDKAAMKLERDSLISAYEQVAQSFVATGINYPSHEVNYEQSIVAPAVTFLCEMYQLTQNKQYLQSATLQLRSLEAFNGRQPDVHLHEIAIRHWDGYWFGKHPTWGDVMPHYWSTLTAVAFQKYFECVGDSSYQQRARVILENNLLNFEEDGTAHCAYIYPASVDGHPGKFYDQFANDQDWALVFYNEVIQP